MLFVLLVEFFFLFYLKPESLLIQLTFFFLIGLFVCLFFADILKYKLGVLVLARISHWDDLSQNWHSFP